MKAALLALIFLTTSTVYADSVLNGAELKICNRKQKCLLVESKRGEIGFVPSLYVLRDVKLTGLGMDNKEFSSVVVDLGSAQLTLRERKQGQLVGEWFVDMNTLATRFSGVL